MWVPDALCINKIRQEWIMVTKLIKTTTNISTLSPTHLVSNIHHQHCCYISNILNKNLRRIISYWFVDLFDSSKNRNAKKDCRMNTVFWAVNFYFWMFCFETFLKFLFWDNHVYHHMTLLITWSFSSHDSTISRDFIKDWLHLMQRVWKI